MMDASDPTDPQVSAQRAKYRGKVKTGIRQRAGHFLRENEWFWAAVFLVVVFAMFTTQFRVQPPPSLPLGAVSTRDLRAPFDLQIVDKVATSQRQSEARAKVLPVYDWNPALSDQLQDRVASVFDAARGNTEELKKYLEQKGLTREQKRAAEEQYLGRLSETLGGGVSRYALRQLQAEGFSTTVERSVEDIIAQVERRKIVPDGDQFQGADAITIRDIRTPGSGWVQKSPGSSDIITLSDARRLPGTMAEGLLDMPGPLRGAIEEFAQSVVRPNLTFNSQETNARRERAASQVEPLVVYLRKGQVILKAGVKVDESALQKIEAFQQASRAVVDLPLLGALFFMLLLLLAFTFMYLKTYRKYRRPDLNLFVLVLQIAAASLVIAQLFHLVLKSAAEGAKSDLFDRPEALMFLIPVAAGAMLVTLLVDKHIAVVYTLLFAVLFGILMDFSFGLLLFCMLSCFTGIYAATNLAQRTAQWKASLLVGAVNMLLAAGVLAAEPAGDLTPPQIIVGMACGFLAGLPLTLMLVSTLLPLFESAFGILTEVRLLELSNMNHPILRRLAIDAPGTYNHSMMMATLSEAAANAIGANALFCRVACYYHDIGKMLNPIYFVENQQPGQNPHDRLAPRISALIVAAHVKEGIAIGRQYKLPKAIIDVIPQHHGTRRISYFLDKALTMVDPEKESIQEGDFRYPGPKPQSREAAVVMLTDAVEAGSRVLRDPSQSRLRALIAEIVQHVLAEGQLDECDLTFRDLAKVEEAFYQILRGVFTRRISYPGYTFDKEADHDEARGQDPQPPAKAAPAPR